MHWDGGHRLLSDCCLNFCVEAVLKPGLKLMSYQEQLNPWVVERLLPNLKWTAVARFRHRNDAEAYVRIVRRTMPHFKFTIAFDSKRLSATSNDRVPQEAIANS